MAVDYTTLLTTEQKREILAQRMTQFAAEAYQHSLNKLTCEALNDTEGVEATDKAITTLEAAINVHAAELSALGDAE